MERGGVNDGFGRKLDPIGALVNEQRLYEKE